MPPHHTAECKGVENCSDEDDNNVQRRRTTPPKATKKKQPNAAVFESESSVVDSVDKESEEEFESDDDKCEHNRHTHQGDAEDEPNTHKDDFTRYDGALYEKSELPLGIVGFAIETFICVIVCMLGVYMDY